MSAIATTLLSYLRLAAAVAELRRADLVLDSLSKYIGGHSDGGRPEGARRR